MSRGQVLLVDDDPQLLQLLQLRLQGVGYRVHATAGGDEALGALASFEPGVVVSDLRMAGMDGLALLRELQQRRPGLPVILLTAHGTIPDAVAATQQGALGFLTKPIDKDALLEHVAQALRLTGSGGEADDAWRAAIIARSTVMEGLLAEAQRVAEAEVGVLITGESGTGKELLAQAIHRASPRRDKPFVAINCGAIPEQLLESELFGHKKGAFTGAVAHHTGLFQTAHGGTLFLDEIGDMPMALQVKLLRALQEQQIRPVGETRPIPVDARVIAATHQNLRLAMADNTFREDLYYRLNVVELRLPPLRERREDIPLLVHHTLERIANRRKEAPKVYAPDALELLAAAEWPGNIRQLVNVIEQNVALTAAPVINTSLVRRALGQTERLPSLREARDAFTRDYLIQLLRLTNGNVARAARLAERNRTDFYKLLRRHNVDPADFKDP
ncbi:MAG: sigma 54-interacting transcriptional regulator [Candidatus Competibacterales bacterium]